MMSTSAVHRKVREKMKAETYREHLNELQLQIEELKAKLKEAQTGDLISRQAAIDALEREKTYCTAFREGYAPIDVFEKYNAGLTDGIKALKNLPSTQPEIVRCKDCIHWKDFARVKTCDVFDWESKKNDFCSFAERRADGF